jgi:hypothetical protein
MLESQDKQENSFQDHILFFYIMKHFKIVVESLNKSLALLL